MFENASPYLDNATVVIDGSGERAFRKEFTTYLRKQVNQPNSRNRVKSIKIQGSHDNNLLQLADFVVGATGRMLTGKRGGAQMHKVYLASHEETRRVWPR